MTKVTTRDRIVRQSPSPSHDLRLRIEGKLKARSQPTSAASLRTAGVREKGDAKAKTKKMNGSKKTGPRANAMGFGRLVVH